MQPCQALITSPDVLNKILPDKPGAVHIGTLQAVLVGCIIIGGIRSIAQVTGKLVPFMLLIYVLGALAVLIMNRAALPAAINSIWQHAFSMEGMAGGWGRDYDPRFSKGGFFQ